MLSFCAFPASSTQVRTCRASGRKQSPCRDQSRGPAGPEIIAYISLITAPIWVSSLIKNLVRKIVRLTVFKHDWPTCVLGQGVSRGEHRQNAALGRQFRPARIARPAFSRRAADSGIREQRKRVVLGN